jgi:hypothetical protein
MMGALTFLFDCLDSLPVLNLLLKHTVVSFGLSDCNALNPFFDFPAFVLDSLLEFKPHFGESGL